MTQFTKTRTGGHYSLSRGTTRRFWQPPKQRLFPAAIIGFAKKSDAFVLLATESNQVIATEGGQRVRLD